MPFNLTDSERQAEVRAMVHAFVDKEVAPRVVEYNRQGSLPPDLVEKVAAMGLIGGVVPEQYGGSGMDYVTWAICVEEVARYCTALAATIGYPSSLVGQGLMRWGTEEQKQRFLAPLARGECLAAAAITEPDCGSDAAAIRTVAVRQGDNYKLTGQKTWISNANTCRWMLVFATVDPSAGRQGITAFLVERESPGLETKTITNKLSSRVSDTGEVFFSETIVPREHLLGDEGTGWSILLASVGAGRLHVAARSVGIAQGSLELSRTYALNRKAFGREIGKMQLVQQMLANMAISTESARLLVYRAAAAWDTIPGGDDYWTSMAKLHAARTAMAAAHDAVQIHGAYGMSDEFHVERHFREAKMQEIVDGTNEIQTQLIAKALLSKDRK